MTTITLSTETEKLLEERMRRDGHDSPDQAVRAALLVLNDADNDDSTLLDDQTLAAIEGANLEVDRGEGIPVEEAFRRLRAKHLGA
ncbi:hypothetical protein [Humisphaera borealis]|uniref:Type II toxin-antitoxin system ParD family antitoxin n=1 Tax=Humisphaera borealis TaxID=2807512 RepID=A0A7M2WSQ1_9BACT|nr:hypothetical protein [Humisphaera borealis]QOV88527.1 hypothetical protein IPV69_20115 [Humisphaera borealis]